MSREDRREFIKKLAKGTAYAAPVVHSLAAPLDLVGQGQSSQHKKTNTVAAPGAGGITQQQQIGAPPPGDRRPPGSQQH